MSAKQNIPLRALFDLQLGKTDLIEFAPNLMRRTTQEKIRIWKFSPATLLALHFDDAQAPSADARMRKALPVSLDRGTTTGVLLQKQAEPVAALLPQWLSGYAFLFTVDTNLDRAREMPSAQAPQLGAAGAQR